MTTVFPASLGARCALACLLASVGGTLQASDTIEARNAAVGLAMTHGMFVDMTLGQWCGALPAPKGPAARTAQAGWKRRNAEPVVVSSLWINALGEAISARMGTAAGAQFHQLRKAEFGETVSRMQQALFADGKLTPVDCARITDAVASGTFDVSASPGVADTFRLMGAELLQRGAD
ncbi:hypothetical protein AO715_07540 [Xanthomonas sp. Mitacek01]|nr:hypothetical protein AO715_07540 [Xanthomonas sp. Mitacek01]